MRQPEERASSARRTPSTPTAPDSVGRPPRRATRNSLSQRFSRLVMTAFEARGDLPGEDMMGSVAGERKERKEFTQRALRAQRARRRKGRKLKDKAMTSARLQAGPAKQASDIAWGGSVW